MTTQRMAHIFRGMSGSVNGSFVHTSAACCSIAGWCHGGAMTAAAAPPAPAAAAALNNCYNDRLDRARKLVRASFYSGFRDQFATGSFKARCVFSTSI
jgi:hypothetical protein